MNMLERRIHDYLDGKDDPDLELELKNPLSDASKLLLSMDPVHSDPFNASIVGDALMRRQQELERKTLLGHFTANFQSRPGSVLMVACSTAALLLIAVTLTSAHRTTGNALASAADLQIDDTAETFSRSTHLTSIEVGNSETGRQAYATAKEFRLKSDLDRNRFAQFIRQSLERFDQAESQLSASDVETLYCMAESAEACAVAGDFVKALEKYREIRKQSGGRCSVSFHTRLWVSEGDAQRGLGQFEVAAHCYDSALSLAKITELPPSLHAHALERKAWCCVATRQYLEAKTLFEKAIRLREHNSGCTNTIGKWHAMHGLQVIEVCDFFDQADPSTASRLDAAAKAYEHLIQAEILPALAAKLESYCEVKARDRLANTYERLGDLRLYRGKWKLAVEAYESALKVPNTELESRSIWEIKRRVAECLAAPEKRGRFESPTIARTTKSPPIPTRLDVWLDVLKTASSSSGGEQELLGSLSDKEVSDFHDIRNFVKSLKLRVEDTTL